MVLFLAAIPIFLVLIYFHIQRRSNATWESYLQRYREREGHRTPGQAIDPNFQFDQPPADAETGDRGQ